MTPEDVKEYYKEQRRQYNKIYKEAKKEEMQKYFKDYHVKNYKSVKKVK